MTTVACGLLTLAPDHQASRAPSQGWEPTLTDNPQPAKYRNFPTHTVDEALAVAQTIRDDMAGKPMNRLLLANSLGVKPSSSNYRYLLSSSLKYGLTLGTEKADEISLTDVGERATNISSNQAASSLRQAAMMPSTFAKFYTDYNNNKLPSTDMLAKILVSKYEVPEKYGADCARIIIANGERVGIIRQISGSPHVILGLDELGADLTYSSDDEEKETHELQQSVSPPSTEEGAASSEHATRDQSTALGNTRIHEKGPKAIFLGHGRKVGPREKLERMLRELGIPYAVAASEPNLAKPIPTKVRETMMNCGSAILIFTKDQKFFTEDGTEIWRPSENVIHEVGAASLLYEDRIVILKERGIDLPSNFSSLGCIEFEEDGIEAKTVELLKELIGFGLVTVLPAA